MPYHITLTEQDQIMLLDLIAESYLIKCRKLRRPESIRMMSEYYIDACEKIRDNQIVVNHPKKNLFWWLRDNFAHTSDTFWLSARCQQAVLVCEAAAQGRYLAHKVSQNQLFKE